MDCLYSNLREHAKLMEHFRLIEDSYNNKDFELHDKLGMQILHGFFEGLCFILFDNIIFLVGDDMKVMYQ